MNRTDTQIATLLRQEGLLDQFQYRAVLDHLAEHGGRLHLALLDLGMVPEERLMQIVSQVVGFPLRQLSKIPIDHLATTRLSAEFCERHCVFPCGLREGGTVLWLAMADPSDVSVINDARRQSRLEILPFLARPSEIRQQIRQAYGDQLGESAYLPDGLDLSLDPGEEEEFKITDISGKTMIKHTRDIAREEDPPADRPATSPAPVPGPTSPADKALAERIVRLHQNQLKADRIITGLARLLVKKGIFTSGELEKYLSPR